MHSALTAPIAGPVLAYGGDIITRFGYYWSFLMFATGVANLAVAFVANPTTWAWFLSVFPIASKIALLIFQYVATKATVRRRIHAIKAAANR